MFYVFNANIRPTFINRQKIAVLDKFKEKWIYSTLLGKYGDCSEIFSINIGGRGRDAKFKFTWGLAPGLSTYWE